MLVGIAVLVLVVVLLLGVPIPFAFFASSLVIVLGGGYDYTFLLPYGFSKVSSLILVAIPLFILAGNLMEKSGIGESLINFVEMFIGRVRGGLGAVMVVSCALFGSISGSGFATLSCIGSIMLPRMEKAGYPIFPYFEFNSYTNPGAGLLPDNFPPQYSNGYASANNRIGLLLENHIYKPQYRWYSVYFSTR